MACSYLFSPLSHVRASSLLQSVPTHPPISSNYCSRIKSTIYKQYSAKKINTRKMAVDPSKLRSDFRQLLANRRSHQVSLSVELAKPVMSPMYQQNPSPLSREAMEACPKAEIENDQLIEENLYLYTEESEQGRLPVLIVRMKQNSETKRPAIVLLHSTHMCKEWLRPLLEAYASRGYIAIAIDSRYHGERADSLTTYREALVSSWKKGDTMPFIFDTVWDLIKLADYLTDQRNDIDPTRIGITGESLGGMHAIFAAFADTRYAVAAPIIGVQGFRWAIDNDKWQARVDSIKGVFEEAHVDLGKSVIDKEVVEQLVAEPEIGHRMTSTMVIKASEWFDRFL
ncbi:putative esterase YitV [Bienertia sinuspersici]